MELTLEELKVIKEQVSEGKPLKEVLTQFSDAEITIVLLRYPPSHVLHIGEAFFRPDEAIKYIANTPASPHRVDGTIGDLEKCAILDGNCQSLKEGKTDSVYALLGRKLKEL
ncbi:hypothetical protein CMO89_02025 [Candidatus Woesearchaeota archaeon]|nr:hypothetical protein [Candidatus Woesearchaeota archaeon]|tara:strand:+ start:14917 stop:15252 length:336 start_codon:yes stop_codon:yes gene_type:complete